MRTPDAASMSRSSTPARISMPSRVRLSTSHMAKPITIAAIRIAMRTSGYVQVHRLAIAIGSS